MFEPLFDLYPTTKQSPTPYRRHLISYSIFTTTTYGNDNRRKQKPTEKHAHARIQDFAGVEDFNVV